MAETGKQRWLDREKVNLMVAVCAVLISAASFYATYLQSIAAERQVKAETWPFIQFSSSNYDLQQERNRIYVHVTNDGVGPAYVASFKLTYKDQPVRNITQIVELCCLAEGEESWAEDGVVKPEYRSMVTSTPSPRIIPAGESVLAFSIVQTERNSAFWSRLDAARFELKATACYCSLLDDCYETDFSTDPVPVDECRPEPEASYRG